MSADEALTLGQSMREDGFTGVAFSRLVDDETDSYVVYGDEPGTGQCITFLDKSDYDDYKQG